MKFYFCEACGVRVTDADVSDGLARDKKLKGVYCRQCSVGVTTMDTLPMKEGEARKLLDSPESQPTQPAPKGATRKRRTTAALVPPPARPGRPARRESDRTIARPSAPPTAAIVGGSIAAIFALLFLWVVFPAKKNNTKRRPASQARKTQSKKSDAGDESVKRGGATPASDAHSRTVDRPTGNPVPQVDSPHGDPQPSVKSPPTGSIDLGKQPPAKQPPKPDEQARLAAEKAAQESARDLARAQQALREMEAKSFLAQVRGKLATVFKSGRLDPARAVLAEAEKQRDLSPEAVAGLKRERADLEALLALRDQAFAALRTSTGRKAKVGRGGIYFEGVVQAGEEERKITLKHRDGPMFELVLADFELKDVARFAPASKDAEGLRRLGLLRLALGQSEEAGKYFTQARDAGLGEGAKPYLERVSRQALGANEAAARRLWLEAEVHFLSKRWKEALARYDELEGKHADARFLIENRKTLKKRRLHIDSILNPLSPGLHAVYHNFDLKPENQILTRVDSNVNFDWGGEPPDPKVRRDHFSARWTGLIKIAKAGRYTFKMISNDGHRLWIDGNLHLKGWHIRAKPSNMTLDLEPGMYPIRAEFFECEGGATCILMWSLEGGFGEQVVPPSVFFHDPKKGKNQHRKVHRKVAGHLKPGILGMYFRGTRFEKEQLAFRRLDARIDFSWRSGSPDSRIPAGPFCVRWTGYLKIPETRTYTFYRSFKDAEIWINGEQLALSRHQPIRLDAGPHSIRVDFVHNEARRPVCRLLWKLGDERTGVLIPEDVFFHDSRLAKGAEPIGSGKTPDPSTPAGPPKPKAGTQSVELELAKCVRFLDRRNMWTCYDPSPIESQLDFVVVSGGYQVRKVDLINRSKTEQVWQIEPSVPWLRTRPSSGRLAAGAKVQVGIEARPKARRAATYTEALVVRVKDSPVAQRVKTIVEVLPRYRPEAPPKGTQVTLKSLPKESIKFHRSIGFEHGTDDRNRKDFGPQFEQLKNDRVQIRALVPQETAIDLTGQNFVGFAVGAQFPASGQRRMPKDFAILFELYVDGRLRANSNPMLPSNKTIRWLVVKDLERARELKLVIRHMTSEEQKTRIHAFWMDPTFFKK